MNKIFKVLNIIGLTSVIVTGIYYLFSGDMVAGWMYGIMTLGNAFWWIAHDLRSMMED